MKHYSTMTIALIIILFTSVFVTADEPVMWGINYYVNDFGGETDVGYITNTKLIKGTFSNIVVQSAKLNVYFLISDKSEILIKLYEYAGTCPVKSYSTNIYTVLIQDKDGNCEKFSMRSFSDRFKFTQDITASISPDGILKFTSGTPVEWIHKALMKGGTIKFRMIAEDNPTTKYNFDIQNADGYDKAYRKLMS